LSVATTAPPSPYKGLAPFEDSDLDALLFFGREVESEVIAANLIAARITVLYGPSGVGKSSVLRAGVAHRLRQEQEVEVVVFSTWTGDPAAALIEAVGGSSDSLVDALAVAAERAGGDLYLILDQFEECFLYHPRGGRFAAALAEVVNRPGLRVNVLIGMREDALARLDALKAAIPNLLANRLRLDRLDRAAGTAAILGPIERYNTLVAPDDSISIERELVDEVLDEVTLGRVELSVVGRGVAAGGADENSIEAPFLQLVLARLWDVEAERSSRTLRRTTLRELGGAERIVENHLERAMAELSLREKGAAAAMYNFLVTPSGTKIAHGLRDLAGYAAVDEGEAADVLQRLTAERIVRASSENGPATTRYEIFHDVLADAVLAWRTRFEADRRIEEERRGHHRRQRRLLAIFGAALVALGVMAAVAVYALAQRSEARHQAAVAGAALVKAEKSKNVADTALGRADKALKKARASARKERRATLDAKASEARAIDSAAKEKVESQRAERAEARWRDEARHSQLLTHVAQRQTRKAQRATAHSNQQRKLIRARELGASARARLDEDPEESVRKAVQAVAAFRVAARAPGQTMEDTLRDGLLALRLKAVLPGGGAVQVVRYSPDGSLVLVAGTGGARLFDRTQRFRQRRLRPSFGLIDATFSDDGRLVAGAGKNGTVQVWDAQTGLPRYALRHGGSVLSVAFSPDGRLIASGSADGNARLWTVSDGVLVATFEHPPSVPSGIDDVRMVSFSPDSKRLLTVGGDRFARIYDVARGVKIRELNHQAQLSVARFSHDGKVIATGGANAFVRVWDASTGREPLYSLPAVGRVAELAFSPDDSLLAAAETTDTTAHVWNLARRSAVAIVTQHVSGVESIAFSPIVNAFGGMFATTGREGNAYIFRGATGFALAGLIGHRRAVNAAAFSPDGEEVVTASNDGSGRVWNAKVDPVGPLPLAEQHEVGDHHSLRVNKVAFSPDGRRMLSAGGDDAARIWGPGRRALTLMHGGPVNTAEFSKNGGFVITGSEDGTARTWRAATGKPLRTFRHGAPVQTARVSPDGRLAVTAGSDGWARLWDVATGRPRGAMKHGPAINVAAFSPDGRRLVTAAVDGSVVVWRVRDSSRMREFEGHQDAVVAAAFSPNGRWLATASADRTARVWDASSGTSKHTLIGADAELTSLAFSPDGAFLATASKDSDARVWNVRSGEQVSLLRFHQGAVNDVAFSKDGRWLATAGPTAVGIWQTQKRGRWLTHPLSAVRAPLTITNPAVNSVAFSPRGWRIVFGSKDGSVRTFDCTLCGGIKQLTAMAKARLREIVHAKL
jgi:WD40 repeat protein